MDCVCFEVTGIGPYPILCSKGHLENIFVVPAHLLPSVMFVLCSIALAHPATSLKHPWEVMWYEPDQPSLLWLTEVPPPPLPDIPQPSTIPQKWSPLNLKPLPTIPTHSTPKHKHQQYNDNTKYITMTLHNIWQQQGPGHNTHSQYQLTHFSNRYPQATSSTMHWLTEKWRRKQIHIS